MRDYKKNIMNLMVINKEIIINVIIKIMKIMKIIIIII